jgi:hypothetical protein
LGGQCSIPKKGLMKGFNVSFQSLQLSKAKKQGVDAKGNMVNQA